MYFGLIALMGIALLNANISMRISVGSIVFTVLACLLLRYLKPQ